MAKKPKVFQPELTTPLGINNYTGGVFRCFTKGDTLPFRFVVQNAIEDLTDCKVTIIMADSTINDTGCIDEQQSMEIDIPLVDLAGGIFEGEITNIQTQALPAGITYAMAKFTEAPTGTVDDPVPGLVYIIDMCQLEIYPSLTFPTL